MRGKGFHHKYDCKHNRITPAYAGKSSRYIDFERSTQDHPRLCGEKQRGDITGMSFMGSPPPMRGKVGDGFSVAKGARITPAYAGKSTEYTTPN